MTGPFKLPGEETTLRVKIGAILSIVVVLVVFVITGLNAKIQRNEDKIVAVDKCAVETKEGHKVLQAQVDIRLKNIEDDIQDIKIYAAGGKPLGFGKALR